MSSRPKSAPTAGGFFGRLLHRFNGTGRSKAAIAAQQSLVMQRASDIMMLMDNEGRIFEANARALSMYGYTLEELRQLPPGGLRTPESAVNHAQQFALFDGEVTRSYETVHRRKDGSTFPVEISGMAFEIEGHKFKFSIHRDISRRIATEEKLNLHQAAMIASPSSIVITDAQGVIEWANPAFTRASGYSLEEAIGQNPRILKSGKQSESVYAGLWQTILAGQNWHGEFVNKRKNGELFVEDVTIAPIRDSAGAVSHFVAIKKDITARKRAEEGQARLAEIVENTPDFVGRADAEGRIIYVNPAGVRMLGYQSDQELIGRPIAEIHSPESAARIRQEALPIAERVGTWAGETELIARDGRRIPVSQVIINGRANGGTGTYNSTIMRDLTEKNQLMAQYLRAQRLESIGMLATGISHDLNNILAPICMIAPMLREKATDPSEQRMLDTLEKCAMRGAGLVRQILGFAHGASGEPRVVQVKHLLKDISALATETFPKSIVLEQRIPSDLWPITADPTQIHQVLLNLCVNARDAMPDGGTLRLLAENRTIDAAEQQPSPAMPAGNWLVLHIEDTGTGISPENLARIWDPFFTTKSATTGTGLGLSTVRGILERHHGYITVSTKVGEGTAFQVYLPAVVSASTDSLHPFALIGHGKGELILVVDDEAAVRDGIGDLLIKAGYRVLLAKDGVEAASIFGKNASQITMLITDCDMPKLSGADLSQILRNLDPKIKIIATSGVARGNMKIQPEQYSDDFVPKPFTADTILSHVDRVLHGELVPH